MLNKLQITNDCQLKVKAKGIIRRDYLRIWRNCSTFAVAFGNTQVSDVEDEINGLVTYDRKVVKADPKLMRELADWLQKIISE